MAAIELMQVLASGIIEDEVLASEISAIAHIAGRQTRLGEAEALRTIARNHRIRILEAQGWLAALRVEYGAGPRSKS